MPSTNKRVREGKKKKKTTPQVCLELVSGYRVCFNGTMEAMGDFVDLIGSGALKIKSVKVSK